MATMIRAPEGAFPLGAGPPPQGPLLSLPELAALTQAPRRPLGTEFAVHAKPVHLGPFNTGKEHMFETFDDGSQQYIFRGGPIGPYLHAQVDRAAQSPDYNAQGRVLFRRFLPGVTADQAIAPERGSEGRINRDPPFYGIVGSNSNTVVGDDTARRFGQRVGDRKTIGYDSPFSTIPVDPLAPTT